VSLFGGALRPNDPRRFLIEAMVGAMTADGDVSPTEQATIERTVSHHPLFAGLGLPAARTLIDLSMDAIRFAGGSLGRVPSIAKGLPARIHRTAAFGMAAEVAVADQTLEESELSYLEGLRVALRISPLEAESIVAAAQAGDLGPFVDDRYLRIKSMISLVAEVFALRALARGMANDEQRFQVRDFFAAIPDLAMTADQLDTELYRAFRRPRAASAQVFTELELVAQSLPDPVDRYWMLVYALVAEIPAIVPTWRVIPFIGVMQAAFQIVDTDMELAVVDALTFPAAMPRPS
jgi:uncharacterized tellurite resistance protein B-like protein